jgi:hypothetical protein
MTSEEWLQKARPYWPLLMFFLVVLGGALYGVALALLVGSACLLILGLFLAWLSLGELTNEEPLSLDEALELAAPERREQEKASILRALKDLEQEHRFGKITDAEFAMESTRMRQQAKRLLATLDESAKARRIRVEARLKRILKNHPVPDAAAAATARDSNRDQSS